VMEIQGSRRNGSGKQACLRLNERRDDKSCVLISRGYAISQRQFGCFVGQTDHSTACKWDSGATGYSFELLRVWLGASPFGPQVLFVSQRDPLVNHGVKP